MMFSAMVFERCIEQCIHHHKHMTQNSPVTSKFSHSDAVNSSQPLTTNDLFSAPVILPFLECHVNRIMQYRASWFWLFSFTLSLIKYI